MLNQSLLGFMSQLNGIVRPTAARTPDVFVDTPEDERTDYITSSVASTAYTGGASSPRKVQTRPRRVSSVHIAVRSATAKV